MAYQGAVGWVEVEADDVADFVAEPRDTAQHEGLGARQMRSLEGAFRSRQAQSGQIREWKQLDGGDFQIRAMCSVAYKLALVFGGLADITFALTPKKRIGVAAIAAWERGEVCRHAGRYSAALQ